MKSCHGSFFYLFHTEKHCNFMYELPFPAEKENKNMNRQVKINTKYKDRLFRLLFGSYERR
jgi:hypothetical protein